MTRYPSVRITFTENSKLVADVVTCQTMFHELVKCTGENYLSEEISFFLVVMGLQERIAIKILPSNTHVSEYTTKETYQHV